MRRHSILYRGGIFFATDLPNSQKTLIRRKVRKMEKKLYVGNLSYATTQDELQELFSQAGTVASVELIKDRDTGQSKGFAFIEMSNQSEAEKAISTFNGYRLGNREIKVNIARPREERPRGGWYTDVPKKNYDNRNRKNTKRRY
jgi:RNA recognition motif-containing protein